MAGTAGIEPAKAGRASAAARHGVGNGQSRHRESALQAEKRGGLIERPGVAALGRPNTQNTISRLAIIHQTTGACLLGLQPIFNKVPPNPSRNITSPIIPATFPTLISSEPLVSIAKLHLTSVVREFLDTRIDA